MPVFVMEPKQQPLMPRADQQARKPLLPKCAMVVVVCAHPCTILPQDRLQDGSGAGQGPAPLPPGRP